MVKSITAIAAAALITACTVIEKRERYSEAEKRFVNPDCVEFHYERDGETVRGYERRSFGSDCDGQSGE